MDHKLPKVFAAGAAMALAVSSFGAVAAQDDSMAPEMSGEYVIGVSNNVQGNGWREEMICSIKAQAAASGEVASLNIAHRNTDAIGQLEDIRNLIAAGVDAIIVNPSSADALNPAIKEATDAGIVVVAVDQAVTEPSAYILSNNQEQYAYLGAQWLFEKLGGSGDVFYMRGAAGAGADDDRDAGFKRALEEFPDINVVAEVFTGWDQGEGSKQMLDMIASGQQVDGVWTSGIDNVIVDAYVDSGEPLVPIVGADNAGFVGQLASVEGFEGAFVTNPGTVGGAGVTLALDILNGNPPEEQTVYVDPVLWSNDNEEGIAAIAAAQNPNLDPEWPVGLQIPGFTTYTDEDIIACLGPGE
jgi:ribose transport system substrate-binding protein